MEAKINAFVETPKSKHSYLSSNYEIESLRSGHGMVCELVFSLDKYVCDITGGACGFTIVIVG